MFKIGYCISEVFSRGFLRNYQKRVFKIKQASDKIFGRSLPFGRSAVTHFANAHRPSVATVGKGASWHNAENACGILECTKYIFVLIFETQANTNAPATKILFTCRLNNLEFFFNHLLTEFFLHRF